MAKCRLRINIQSLLKLTWTQTIYVSPAIYINTNIILKHYHFLPTISVNDDLVKFLQYINI